MLYSPALRPEHPSAFPGMALESQCRLVPAGEGAGYAGGILSAGIDGIRAAEALAMQILGAGPQSR